jgi:hypothetical protein
MEKCRHQRLKIFLDNFVEFIAFRVTLLPFVLRVFSCLHLAHFFHSKEKIKRQLSESPLDLNH